MQDTDLYQKIGEISATLTALKESLEQGRARNVYELEEIKSTIFSIRSEIADLRSDDKYSERIERLEKEQQKQKIVFGTAIGVSLAWLSGLLKLVKTGIIKLFAF